MSLISIVIPCFNEENTIKEIINKIIDRVNVDKEIIVVDDFSSDKTRFFLQNDLKDKVDKLVLNDQNYGKGYSIKKGLKVSNGEIIIIQDADLEYDPIDLLKFEEVFIKFKADGIIGSRFSYDKYIRSHSILNKIANFLLTFFFNILYNTTFTDVYSCYFAFNKKLLNVNNLKINGFAQHAEVLSKVIKKGSKFYEVPINYNGRNFSEGKK